jgi:hypothetical protein
MLSVSKERLAERPRMSFSGTGCVKTFADFPLAQQLNRTNGDGKTLLHEAEQCGLQWNERKNQIMKKPKKF